MNASARFVVLLTTILAMAVSGLADPPDSLWSHRYGGTGWEDCWSFLPTHDGGYALAGVTQSFTEQYYDFWLVKTRANGDSAWSHTYGRERTDECMSIVETGDGGFALAGNSISPDVGSYQFYLVRTDSLGEALWSHAYGGVNSQDCRVLRQTPDGGFLLAGSTSSFGHGEWDYWLVRTNAQGDSLWSRTYGGSRLDRCYAMDLTNDGGCVLVGSSTSFHGSPRNIWLVKTNANGDTLWTRSYGFPETSFNTCYAIQATADGGYVLAGRADVYTQSASAGWVLKVSATGDSLWGKMFGSLRRGKYDEFRAVREAFDGSVVMTGTLMSVAPDSNGDCWIMRVEADGDSLWSRTFGGRSPDWGHSVYIALEGNYLLGGGTRSYGAQGSADIWFIKTGPDGGRAIGEIRRFGPLSPIERVAVYAAGGLDTVFTDRLGRYGLGLRPGTYTLAFHHPLYCDTLIPNIFIESNQFTRVDAVMNWPTAGFSRTSISLSTWPENTVSDTFQIVNPSGNCPLSFSISDTSAWLSTTPESGMVDAGRSALITVTADVRGLPGGSDRQSELRIAYNAELSPYVMPVDLYVASSADELAQSMIPTVFALLPNSPNPFNATTVLRFDVPMESQVDVTIYNVTGQEVAHPVSDVLPAGRHSIFFDAHGLPSGMYFTRMTARHFAAVEKMLLLK